MILRARWVLPIDRAPVAGGWIEAIDGRIVRVGDGAPPGPSEDIGDVALLPGLVNAHTHVELSWMAGRIPPSDSLVDWIRQLLALRANGPGRDSEAAMEAMVRAAVTMHATGTVLVGDISNTLLSMRALVEAGLGGVIFHEVLGFSAPDPVGAVQEARERLREAERAWAHAGRHPLRFGVVAHAPYSVSPALFAEVARVRGRVPLAVHVGESAEEVEFLRNGTGPLRRLLEDVGVWTPSWTVPGCDPIEYLERVDYLHEGMLAVHAVHLDERALERLRAARGVVVTCPRSNLWVGSGPPRLAHLYASQLPVAIGTDSLASAPTLNLFDELAEMRRIAPEVSAAALLDSATRRGAEVLGFGHEYGTLTPGKRAALVAVDVPASVRDVEEYLVGGVPPEAVRRVA